MEQTGRIGLIIGLISEGERMVYKSEAAKKWEQYYIDPRNYLKKVENEENESGSEEIFTKFICYGDNVALILLTKGMRRRAGDVVIGMITIPSNIDISGEELEDIIEKTQKELNKAEFDSDYLDELYAKEYPVLSIPYTCYNSYNNELYAYQKYGNGTGYELYELLNKNLYSPCYNKYKAVFLIDAETAIKPKEEVVELTQEKIEKFATLRFPHDCEYHLTINGEEFKSDRSVTLYDKVEILVQREGFQEQTIEVEIDQPIVDVEDRLKALEWGMIVYKKWFPVAELRKPEKLLESVSIFVKNKNGEETEIIDEAIILEKEFGNTRIIMRCEGYIEKEILFEQILELWETDGKEQKIALLEREPKTYKYVIRSKGPISPIGFSVKDAKYEENVSPLAGYKVDNKRNGETLYLERDFFAKDTLWIAVAILIIGLFVGGGSVWLVNKYQTSKQAAKSEKGTYSPMDIKQIFQHLSNNEFDEITQTYPFLSDLPVYQNVKRKLNPEQNTTNSGELETDGSKRNYVKIKKLLNTSKWEKSEFQNAGFGDLYEAVNTYNYSKFLEIYNVLKKKGIGKLNGNDYVTWNKIKEACENRNHKELSGTYSEDGEINLSNWIQKVVHSPMNYECLQDQTWSRKKFTDNGFGNLYDALLNYNFEEIMKYKDHFHEKVNEYLQEIQTPYPKVKPLRDGDIIQMQSEEYKIKTDEITIYVWGQRLLDATKKNNAKGKDKIKGLNP